MRSGCNRGRSTPGTRGSSKTGQPLSRPKPAPPGGFRRELNSGLSPQTSAVGTKGQAHYRYCSRFCQNSEVVKPPAALIGESRA
jgi:hypothetical protein